VPAQVAVDRYRARRGDPGSHQEGGLSHRPARRGAVHRGGHDRAGRPSCTPAIDHSARHLTGSLVGMRTDGWSWSRFRSRT
jgi:hypothetical protein